LAFAKTWSLLVYDIAKGIELIDHFVFWGLCAVLVFVPLPIGSVEEWAVFVFEAATITLFLLHVGSRSLSLEEGRYVMGVQAPTGSYNFHYSIMIKSDALAKLSVAMKPGSEPVMLQSGFAEKKKTSIVDFFKSPAGIITALTVVEGTLFAIVLLEEDEASPIID